MRHIPVVDDDPHMGLAIRAWLERYGFKVAIADGGLAGLAAIDNSTFDLMIVDIFMPDMRGFESIRIFHERAPRVPLIAVSDTPFPIWRRPVPISCNWRSGLARRAACASPSGQQPC